jgi:hypothetical protein
MTTPVRFTSEKRQELISRNQFCERLVEFGWIPVSPEDLGEDFVVHIYFEGQATGTSFYVQEKSVINLHDRKKGDFLPYSFDVKDIQHWEKFVQPVVLVVWDIKLREGRWALLKDAIAEINQKRPKWRNQKETRIYIPWNNTTDNNGLLKLQYKIGKFMFPIIYRDKELDMKMNISLPDSQEGIEVAKSLKKFINDGDEVTLKGNFIESIEIPDWAKPWFDTDFAEIKMGSLGSSEPIPVDVNIISTDGKTETMKGVELKVVKSGMQTMQLSNEHQAYPLKFEFVFSSSMDCRASVGINNLGGNVNITLGILKFTRALAAGGKLQLFSQKDNAPLPIDIPVPSLPKMEPDPNFYELVERLCLIQAKIGKFIQLPSDLNTISQQDVQTVNELVMIIMSGQLKRKIKEMEYEFKIEPPNDIFEHLNKKEPISFTLIHDKSSGQLFGRSIEMGKAVEQIKGTLDMTFSQLENAIGTYKVEEGLHLRLLDCESIVTFPDWGRNNKY